MAVSIQTVDRRIYFVGNTFPLKDRIKAMGGHWDGERRQWWVGIVKMADAQALAESTLPTRVLAESVGLRSDAPDFAVADKLRDEGREMAADAVQARYEAGPRQQRDPREVTLHGKGTWKGRPCYVGVRTRDERKVHICGLPKDDGSYFEHWVPVAEVTITREYRPKLTWNGRRGRHSREEWVHQTLGSIAAFLRKQRDPNTRRVQCPECDAWHDANESCRECGGC